MRDDDVSEWTNEWMDICEKHVDGEGSEENIEFHTKFMYTKDSSNFRYINQRCVHYIIWHVLVISCNKYTYTWQLFHSILKWHLSRFSQPPHYRRRRQHHHHHACVFFVHTRKRASEQASRACNIRPCRKRHYAMRKEWCEASFEIIYVNSS